MGRRPKGATELEVRQSIGWREYFASGMKRGISTVPTKNMLVTHVDEATGVPTYQGEKILHTVSDGRGDDKEQFIVEVLYDIDYVQYYLYDIFTSLGLITNNTINQVLWENWFNPTTGKIHEYGTTEGQRKQEQVDLESAKQMASMIEGSSVEEWLEIIRQKRAKAIAELNSEPESPNGNSSTAKAKKAATAK